ncbi:hypothetical protein ACWFZ6_23810 [Methylorubrum extorquens]|jgi:hypothetical protein|uniref:hypothetical protein n=1 Tax=Methylorubrum TaxID=2282523 RepID=UPI00209CB8D9|nr:MULTISPECIES: hypothetical protein [Methylorubrum]MDF9861366.1 hypothetical protein [Methylorubrum pseudosasae]MDH6634993.1 hypothetical protein [Methylobacterium sp. SuP10 SLI 274]MDH6664164.1 hypothetical protein [Methylorubrum zatmanii]MCP1561168.1 hypothetical protein [Methylorubrum extorquens]MDF9789651.1 hypothetical protein [Methylorubrum extorquens]
MKTVLTAACGLALAVAGFASLPISAGAQTRSGSGAIVTDDGSVTGGRDRGVTISRGATGADTITNNSAAGGNANQPERAVPQGSGGGGSGSGPGN